MSGDWSPGESRPERQQDRGLPAGFVRFDSDLLRLVALIGAAAVVLGAVWVLRGRAEATSASLPAHADARPTDAPGQPVAPGVPAADPTAVAAGPSPSLVTVDVRGAVESPGVRQLPAGSRVIDAINAAGGVRRGHGYGAVNLAKVLVDGEQLVVGKGAANGPAPGSPGSANPSSAPSGTPAGGLINLNTATAADLEALDGIGPVLAGNIVDWRTTNGPFQSVEDLLDVSGIGEQTLAGLRDQVTVG